MNEKVDLSQYNNKWYKPGSKLKIILWFVLGRIFINTYLPIPIFFKKIVLRLFGMKIGKRVVIKPKVNIKYPWFLAVGDDVWIGEQVWIDNYALCQFENNTVISQGGMLLTGNHNYKKVTFDLMIDGIILKEGAWMGAKSLVTSGVELSHNSVLAAGSVATSSLEPYGIYQGNPAVKVRERKLIG